MKFKIGEIVYIDGRKSKVTGYSDLSHRYKVKLETNKYLYLKDCDIIKVDELWRKR